MGAIFLASSTPSSDLPDLGLWDTLFKKGGHLTGYALLALGVLRGLDKPGRKAALITLGLVFLYAASDELHQSFTPGRHPSPLDVGIDMLGASLACGLWLVSARVRRFVRAFFPIRLL
jgi:VanZ family protein